MVFKCHFVYDYSTCYLWNCYIGNSVAIKSLNYCVKYLSIFVSFQHTHNFYPQLHLTFSFYHLLLLHCIMHWHVLGYKHRWCRRSWSIISDDQTYITIHWLMFNLSTKYNNWGENSYFALWLETYLSLDLHHCLA